MTAFGRNWRPAPRANPSEQLMERAEELRASLRPLDPELVAAKCAVSYLQLDPACGELHVPLWGNVCTMTWPELNGCYNSGDPLPPVYIALLLYYLSTGDGYPLTNSWSSFGDLPGGRTYNQAFQGYTGDEISKVFSLDLEAFKTACEKIGGEFVALGDAAYRFQALPRVPVLAVYHLGDEDFPSTCKILFDSSATHYVPIDACAVMGSMLAQKIIKNTTLHFIQDKKS